MTSVKVNREALKKRIFQQSNLLPLLIWASLGMGAFGVIFGFLNFLGILYVAGKDVPSLVQLNEGRSVLVEPVNGNYRTPEVVKSFVEEAMSQLFTWNAAVEESGSRRLADKGIEVGGGQRIPTRTWRASFAISNEFGFRETFLAEMATSFIPRGVMTGDAQSALLIDNLTEPREIKPGVWEVNMVAFLVIFDGQNPQGKATEFNKTIIVEAVEPTLDPLPTETSPIQKAVYETRSKGLIISEIYELESEKK